MINPISSVSQGMSGAAPLNEAVVRFGASQESREQQRQERVTADEKVEAPVDEATIECSEELADSPQQGAQPPATGESKSSHHGHKAGSENSVNQRVPGQDGSDEQRESAVARHAAEQHGKHESHREIADRSQRSTREMMGRIETSRAIDESAAPQSATQTASDDSGASAASTSRGSDSQGSADVGDASGGGDSGAVASPGVSSGSAAPRIGGDVIAAAVSSGVTTTEEIAPGSAQADDRQDDAGQDVDSSQEARLGGYEEQGKRVSRQRSLDGSTDFHDGDGGRDEKNQHRFQSGGQQQQQSEHQPPREASLMASSVTDLLASAPADPPSTDGVAAAADASSIEAAASTEAPPAAAPASASEGSAAESQEAVPAAGAQPDLQPSSAATAAAQPPTSSPETYERTVQLTPGLETLGGDEYFFFDDARFAPEPPAAAS